MAPVYGGCRVPETRMLKILDRLEETFVILLMAGATLVTFVAVIRRYMAGLAIPGVQDWLLSLDLSWAQELTVNMFVWMAFFSAAYGVRIGIHVGVDVLVNRLNDRNRFRMVIVGLLAGALFTGLISVLGTKFVWENGAHYAWLTWRHLDTGDIYEGPTTPDLEWPTWKVYLAIPLGGALICFRFLQVAYNFYRTGNLPHHDHGHVEGIEEEAPPAPGEEDLIYRMDDDLHPRDLGKHEGDER